MKNLCIVCLLQMKFKKLTFNVRDIPIKYWGNDRMVFVLAKLKDLESVVK